MVEVTSEPHSIVVKLRGIVGSLQLSHGDSPNLICKGSIAALKGTNGGVREVKGGSGRWEKLPYIVTLNFQPLLRFCTAAVQLDRRAVVPAKKNNRTNHLATAQPPHQNRSLTGTWAVPGRNYRMALSSWAAKF